MSSFGLVEDLSCLRGPLLGLEESVKKLLDVVVDSVVQFFEDPLVDLGMILV